MAPMKILNGNTPQNMVIQKHKNIWSIVEQPVMQRTFMFESGVQFPINFA